MSNKKLKHIIYTAVFASIICAVTLTIKIPAFGSAGGYYHIGDAFIYLAGVCLFFPYAPIAGAIGASLADLLSGYAVYAVPTFIIKALMALFFTNKKSKILCAENFLAVVIAFFITVAGYYITEVVMLNSFVGAAAALYGNAMQAFVSAVIFIATGIAVDKTNLRNKMFK